MGRIGMDKRSELGKELVGRKPLELSHLITYKLNVSTTILTVE
jgi:hypothetical protein